METSLVPRVGRYIWSLRMLGMSDVFLTTAMLFLRNQCFAAKKRGGLMNFDERQGVSP